MAKDRKTTRVRMEKPHRIEATIVPFRDSRGRFRFKVIEGTVRLVKPCASPQGGADSGEKACPEAPKALD